MGLSGTPGRTRQTLVLTPALTAQVYAQLFSGFGAFGPFYTATASRGSLLHTSDLQPVDRLPLGLTDPTFHSSQLVVNATLCWQIRVGSQLWLMYFRNQAEMPSAVDSSSLSLGPRGLGSGPTVEGVFLKLVYLFR
jgi:hypothetical protein